MKCGPQISSIITTIFVKMLILQHDSRLKVLVGLDSWGGSRGEYILYVYLLELLVMASSF